jgi:predicted transcriptional regulator
MTTEELEAIARRLATIAEPTEYYMREVLLPALKDVRRETLEEAARIAALPDTEGGEAIETQAWIISAIRARLESTK